MGPVSGQVRRWLEKALQEWRAGHPGLAGLCREFEGRADPLSWAEFTCVLARSEPLLGGRQALVDASRDFAAAQLEARASDHFGFADERQAFWLTSRVLAPALFPELDWRFDAEDDGTVRIEVAIPEELPASPALFAVLEGVLAAVPRAAARRQASVRSRFDARRARFEIASPPAEALDLDTRRLAALTDHSGSVFIEADADGRVVFVSPNCRQIFGLRPEGLVGRTPQELEPSAGRDVALDLSARLEGSEEPVLSEFRFDHPESGARWGAVTCHVFRTETGARHFVTVARDVTEQKEAERLRQERGELLERVARATPDVMLVIDLDGGEIKSLAEDGVGWPGMPPGAIEGQPARGLDQLIHPDDLAKLAAHRRRATALGPGEVCEVEMRARQPDGSWRWLRLRDVVFSRRDDGSPRELLVCIGDVTEQVETREALAESRRRYQRVSELGSDYSFCTRIDPDGTIEREWMTDAFFRITGYREDEVPPDRWEEPVHPDDHAICRSTFAEGIAQGSGSVDFRLLTRSGETRWIHERFDVVREGDGVLRLYGACRDVTDQRRAEDERRGVEERYRAITE
ncbi:MAG: PAS domain-containing protein, partial [Myxococcota bacterium]